VTADDAFFECAVWRMRRSALWLSGAGTIAAWLLAGWACGLGFLAGGLASYANFHWLHRMTATLGSSDGAITGPRKRMVLFLCLRYLLLGLGGYVIVKFFRLNLTAALVGLFVVVAAVILEILYEMIYAR
jgi:hypothetical protein